MGTVRRRNITSAKGKSPVTLPIDALMRNDFELYEKLQEPKYEEAYRKMRQLIPLDMYKSNLAMLLEQGIPQPIAERFWNNKILWLIVMHPEDISKIHLADFRGKYSTAGLDIVELRAIWYNLPVWNPDGNSTNALEVGKAEWKSGLKARLDDYNYKESRDTLPLHIQRNEVYEDYDDLVLFDYEVELKKRFDRSASYTAQAIDSPAPVMPRNKLKNLSSSHLNLTTITDTVDNDLNFDLEFDEDIHCIVDGAGSFEFDNVRNNFEHYKSFAKGEQYSTLLDEINAEVEDENYDIDELDFDSHFNESNTAPTNSDAKISDGDQLTHDAFKTPSMSLKSSLNAASSSPIVDENVRARHSQVAQTPYFQKMIAAEYEREQHAEYDERQESSSKAFSPQRPKPKLIHISNSSPTNSDSGTPNINRYTSPVADTDQKSSDGMNSSPPSAPGALLESVSQKAPFHRSTPSLSSSSNGSINSLVYSKEKVNSNPLNYRGILHKQNKSDGSDYNDSIGFDADTQTVTTRESSLRTQLPYSPPHVDESLTNKYGEQPSVSTSPTAFTDSINGMHNKNGLEAANSTVAFTEARGEGQSKANNNSMETPISMTLTSESSSHYRPDFLHSVESRGSYTILLNGRPLPRSIDDEVIQPQMLHDHLDFNQSYDELHYDAAEEEDDDADVNDDCNYHSAQVDSDEGCQLLSDYIRDGEIERAKPIILKCNRSLLISRIKPTQLLLHYSGDASLLSNPWNTFAILIDMLNADVNTTDANGRTPLHHMIMQPEIGSLLLVRGANILLCDDSGMCPLSLSLNHSQDWLLNNFEACGREAYLLEQGSSDELFRYTTYLILAGYSTKARNVIELGRVVITADDATALMSSCMGNFENMKEPVETYELLEALGARMDDL
eukprot:gene22653-30933_t